MRALIAILALVAGLVLAARLLWAEYETEDPQAIEVEIAPAPDADRQTDASDGSPLQAGLPEDTPPLSQAQADEDRSPERDADADDFQAKTESPGGAGQPPQEAPLPPVEDDSPYRPRKPADDESEDADDAEPASRDGEAGRDTASGDTPNGLIIPVEGVQTEELYDSWGDARGEERSHQGLDIHAEAGTPVLAAADGEIVKFFDSVPGGTTIYQMSEDKDFIYYYAHLESRENGVSEGDSVRQGDVIGYVGSTGNAGETPHLHFEIQRSEDGESWWRGEAINPFDVLKE